MLLDRGIRPEALPPAEDIKKVERRLKADEKKILTKKVKYPAFDKAKFKNNILLSAPTLRIQRITLIFAGKV